MTENERAELLDLYVDDALPEALQSHVETYLAAHPDAAAEVSSLKATAARLKAVPTERPDNWFIERALDRLLREHAGAQEPNPIERLKTAQH